MDNKAIIFKDSSGNAVYPCPYYPVGSIYMSVNNINPSNFFGGTWEEIKDKFLLSAGDIYSAGSTGGEETHTLTVDEMPNHSHSYIAFNKNITNTDQIAGACVVSTQDPYTDSTTSIGGSKAHNNMPPYLAVYVWKRIA